MTEPTPRPWTIGTEHPQDFLPIEKRPIKGGSRPIGQCWGNPYGKEVAQANARLIVTAVNCYEELLAACEEIAKGEAAYDRDPLKHCANCVENMKSIANAAIAKARGQTGADND